MTHSPALAYECVGQLSQDSPVQAFASDVVTSDHAFGHASPWGSPLASRDTHCELRSSDRASNKVAYSNALRSEFPKACDALPLEHLQSVELDMVKTFFEKHAMWSSGSAAHVSSHCIPCRNVHSRSGCKDGQSCAFCHMPHAHKANANRNRASKAKRLRCRQILGLLADEFASTSDCKQASPVLQFAASQSSYFQTFLRHWLTSADTVSNGPSSLNVKEMLVML